MPDKNRRYYFQTLSNYKEDQFLNQSHTPSLTEGTSMTGTMLEMLKKHDNRIPENPVPHIQTDLLHLHPDESILVWFGHSSYFMQLEGKTVLADPVFSGYASPFRSMVKSFSGADNYDVEQLPYIDFLFISHDHWDHLDFQTMEKLKTKTGKVICGLGVGQHFEYWGWDRRRILEKNWYESVVLENGFVVTLEPGRHFSGRGLKRNVSLWIAFVLQTSSRSLFLGGDSGYDVHFKNIGDKYGGFDLAILECGQYDKRWAYIHMQPEQTLQAAKDLHAKCLFPVHHSKFALANHAWNEPLDRITALATKEMFPIITPQIGEKIDLNHLSTSFPYWWRHV
ncbi:MULTISPECIES: MBL fold metallo-hydrolase [Chitinophagaceae]